MVVRTLILLKDGFICSKYSLLNPREFENGLRDYCESVGYENVSVKKLHTDFIGSYGNFQFTKRNLPVNSILESKVKIGILVAELEDIYDIPHFQYLLYIITDDGLVIPNSTYRFY